MIEHGRRQDNGMCFDDSNIPLFYTVVLFFDSASIVRLFVISVNISFFQ